MSDNKNIDSGTTAKDQADVDSNLAVTRSDVASVTSRSSVKNVKTTTAERQIKFERAQKCLENAALVSKRIKEHRKATAELLGRPFEDDVTDSQSELASAVSEKTGYSVAIDTSTTLSVQDALNIPGISESLANTLKQKEILMERIKQYKEISKRPIKTSPLIKKEVESAEARKSSDNTEVFKLTNIVKEKENALSIMQVKIKAMEATIMDLQEKIHEKDQIIEAKNKATTIISDNLTKKEKDTLDLLKDTKEQMTKMQNNFIAMESEWKEEKCKLLEEINIKDEKIKSLHEANTILENSRFEISIANSKLVEELELKNREIIKLQEKLSDLSKTSHIIKPEEPIEEEKGSKEILDMTELTKKIEILEQLNFQIRQTNKELENQLSALNKETKPGPSISPMKKGSPLPSRKGRNTASKMKSPWSKLSAEALNQETEKKVVKTETTKSEMILQALNKDILDKEYVISQKEDLISELQLSNNEKESLINKLKDQILSQKENKVGTVDVGLCTETITERSEKSDNIDSHDELKDVHDLEVKLKEAQEQIVLLNEEIESANKNMIKVKSNSKLKLKQMQKTIDNLSKVSDTNAEMVRLNEEIHQLSQKVAELEEEKGNLQLHLVDYDSGRLTDTDIYKKMLEMENIAEARLKSISLLETQKFDLVQELHNLQQKNAEMEDRLADITQLQNEQVCSEIKSVQLEEQIDQLTASKKELELVIENLKLDKEQVERNINTILNEKEELVQKLEHYVQENMDLNDKLEKLSAEKVSSAESIEIVESLTTQEKMEIEKYNKSIEGEKADDNTSDSNGASSSPENISISKILHENAELKSKIELFSQERQEVMEKMNKICIENNKISENIEDLENEKRHLQIEIEKLNEEKITMSNLHQELLSQIDELKNERVEIIKEAADIKPLTSDDLVDSPSTEGHQEDKSVNDKSSKGAKTVKQLTKEILKLKNIIKEREDEIGDCQMKILSLEEQQQKQKEIIKTNTDYETKISQLSEENKKLKTENDSFANDKTEQIKFKETIENLHHEMQRVKNEYNSALHSRDTKIQELEHLLVEYEKQIFSYGNSLQQKDKDLNDYINQVTKLNDISQKLKLRVEALEEEKAKDQNVEVIKSLNKQIALYQNALADCEDKLRTLEEEKSQLSSVKTKLENKNLMLETDVTKLKETLNENQKNVEELRRQIQKQKEDFSEILSQSKERDEEIHEIKLQLRKESIENEKLRTMIQQKEQENAEMSQQYDDMQKKFDAINTDQNSQSELCTTLENKNKELLEKLKKFALSIKKKSAMYSDLENQLKDLQKQFELKSEQYEQALIQVETIPALQEKLKHANEEIDRLTTEKNQSEVKYMDCQREFISLQSKHSDSQEETSKLIEFLNSEIKRSQEESVQLKSYIDSLNNKIVEYEIEQKNNTNLLTKISCLEVDINQKQAQIIHLTNELQNQEQNLNRLQFGHDAKVQERDMYIENLQIEMEKYKSRIDRLQETISVMENRRQSLERKADQLDVQLLEKQKSYSEYTTQEDELVTRLAVLMDHDRVLEKQLQEIEKDNKELQNKVQNLTEELLTIQNSYSNLQQHCSILENKSSKVEALEIENSSYSSKVEGLENELRKLTLEHQHILAQRTVDIEDIEAEFNTQIEYAIKEKKVINEKYEKLKEYVDRLENDIQEYRNTIENLHININELSSQNKKLNEKSIVESPVTPDYTDQYITEINRLNAVINSKNNQIDEYKSNINTLEQELNSLRSSVESKIDEISMKLMQSEQQLDNLLKENEGLKSKNLELNDLVCQREDQIKQLLENKKVVFEMNIPKTEGMTISSTIEELSDEQKSLSALQSQILSDTEISNQEIMVKKETINVERSLDTAQSSHSSVEPLIVPKKAYLCSNEEHSDIKDPFNSDEGWGFGDSEETYDVTPGITQLSQEIEKLKSTNENLKKDLDSSNGKLIKALKKLKELKNANDMLANELKISKQIANTSMLDMAIESELSSNLEILEKKVQELNETLKKEKRDKETLSKQNEILKSANEKLIEMKEKMDNEIELWKYNFKQANDKISLSNQPSQIEISHVNRAHSEMTTLTRKGDIKLEEEVTKLENENEELQNLVDSLSCSNKELTDKVHVLTSEINILTQKSLDLDRSKSLKSELDDLKITHNHLNNNYEKLKAEVCDLQKQSSELLENNQYLKSSLESQQISHESDKKYIIENSALVSEIQTLKVEKEEIYHQINSLKSSLENAESLLQQEKQNVIENNQNAIAKQYEDIQTECENLKIQINKANETINDITMEKSSLLEKHQDQINDLESKIDKLNLENDQLLSTVTELRSSVSSAMDQRGFEIAELWKQHLAQRESEFQSIEQDLRMQLNASESKYEQFLESVQSSTQEDTNKILILEQVTSLQNKLQDKEEYLNTLQEKYADVIHQLDLLRSEMEDEKLLHENKLLVQQEEYEKSIKDLRSEMQKHIDENESIATLQTELIATKSVNESLNQRIEEISKNYELKISDLSKIIQQKDSEIFQKTHDYTIMLADRNNEFEGVRKQFLEYEKRVEDLTYEKEAELAILRLKMHENSEHYQKGHTELEAEKLRLSQALNEKIVECTNLNRQITDLNRVLEEYANRAAETQIVLESQELEIVTLKDEIESMKTAMRAATTRIEKHVTFASDTKTGSGDPTEGIVNKELLDAVPRAELDLALYMLHQRDVRCEELTMELTQLLEERDTLQLRLSDSLRSYEELKMRYSSVGLDVSSSSQDTISELPSFSVEKESQFVDTHRTPASRSSSISETDGEKPKLQAKLSELRSVKHSRDVRLRHESEQRQMGMRLLQRDVANLPPEAVEQLNQAHHTLSRDSQSTPTVLLNWLRGKSTPKVVHM
ncbi:unnamed protein product [Leptosia nina]|uniref:Viral A-type inclusion protein n=1 Tax=Leptosia nina TaxID=320188 RepID=A0AAV1JTG1_9NEOP